MEKTKEPKIMRRPDSVPQGPYATNCNSPFAVFEALKGRKNLLDSKLIPVRSHFLVGELVDKRVVSPDIASANLFTQSFGKFSKHKGYQIASPRLFSNIIVGKKDGNVTCDDKTVYMSSACIYKRLPQDKLRVVMADGDWKNIKTVADVFQKYCKNRGLHIASSNVGEFMFECKHSSKYFLRGYTYKVFSVMVNYGEGEFDRVLLCDQNSGIIDLVIDGKCFAPDYKSVYIPLDEYRG